MSDRTTTEKQAWLDELTNQRIALKRQLYAVDSQSGSLSSNGGSKSYTNRSVADIKAKIAEIEKEIASLCAALGVELPFEPSCPVYTINVAFR